MSKDAPFAIVSSCLQKNKILKFTSFHHYDIRFFLCFFIDIWNLIKSSLLYLYGTVYSHTF